jgi:hypothetical protein
MARKTKKDDKPLSEVIEDAIRRAVDGVADTPAGKAVDERSWFEAVTKALDVYSEAAKERLSELEETEDGEDEPDPEGDG